MPPKRQGKSNLPVPLQEGVILKDTEKREWRLGRMIAQGGFGLIYLASPRLDIPVDDTAVHVVKVEYLENGPLFSELKFYQRAAKQEHIEKWKKLKQLYFLGIPVFWGSGQAEHNGKSYRFMVMERLGEDLQTIFEREGRRLSKETVLQLGVRMLDVLEYIHEHEYVHGDIKAANLLLGCRNPCEVYLADYGLSYRYCPNGNHKEYLENPKKGHNGTIEFTSLDAHKGVAPSRRGDLEILGYCMLQWVCGKLPWEQSLRNPGAVQAAKTKLLDELPDSLERWAPAGMDCGEIAKFLENVCDLQYHEKPKYDVLKKILLSGLEGICYNDPLDFATAKSVRHNCDPHHRKAGLPKSTPKQAKEVKESKLENEELAYRRKAAVGMKNSQVQDKQMLAGLNKPLQTEVADLLKSTPKQAKEVKKSKLENEELAHRRKAAVGMKNSQMQDKQMLAGLNKPLQTEASERKEPPHRTHLTEDKYIENGFTYSPVCQQRHPQTLSSSSVCSTSQSVLSEEQCQYIIAIVVLLLLILLSLYFL